MAINNVFSAYPITKLPYSLQERLSFYVPHSSSDLDQNHVVTFASLQDARLLVLHIEGQGKKDVLAAAKADGPETDMPIRAILRRAATPVDIYWAP